MIVALALLAIVAAPQQPASLTQADSSAAVGAQNANPLKDQPTRADSAGAKSESQGAGKTAKKPTRKPQPPKPTSLADELLQKALSARAVTTPPMDSAISLTVAYAYRQKRPAKAKSLLEDAYLTLRDLKSDKPEIDTLKLDIVLQTCAVDPIFAEQYLPDDDHAKEFVLEKLVDVYSGKRDFKKALQLFDRTEDKEQAARPLLERLPKDMDDERERVFSEALSSYRQKQHPSMEVHRQDFGELVVRNWKRLPSNLILDAVDMLLANADPRNASADSGTKQQGMVAVANSTTHLRFDSYYEYRVFQLLPILRELDHTRADALLLELNSLAPIIEQYPDGLESIDASLNEAGSDSADAPAAARYTVTNSVTATAEQDQLDATLDRLEKLGEESPRGAVSQATVVVDPFVRVATLLELARRLLEKHPESAYDALDALSREQSRKLAASWGFRNEATLLALKLPGDIPAERKATLARSLLSRAAKTVRALYEDDNDAHNPNQAIKLYWPSTLAWNELLHTAAKLGPSAVIEILPDVTDPEILPIEQAFAAAALNGMSPWRDESPHVVRKQPMKLAAAID